MKLQDLFKRHFTKELGDRNVFDLFNWKQVNINVKNWTTGEVIFSLENAEFPEHFSETACNIIASNYFRKNVPFLKEGRETSYKQVISRMVNFWVEALKDEKLVETEEEGSILRDELLYMLIAQMWAPNSPQWFNTGLKLAYNIDTPGRGHYYYDEEQRKVVESEYSYERTQGSACFILGVQDSLLGEKSITDTLTTETRLFKFGSGVGSNFSQIRGEGEKLSGGGVSSGLMSFLKTFDANAGAIKSGGTTRRAAKMVVVDADHPDIEELVTWKAREEQKVRDLGKMGYDTSIVGEAYATVSGQNSNNSIRVTDSFMSAVENDEDWDLIGRTDSNVVKTIKARSLWDKMCQSAWACGDPGIQFHDTINNWSTCSINEFGEYEEIVASNPCSEYMFLNDTACNLASLNLLAFVKDEKFNIEDYLHCVSLVHLVLEATIHKGQFPTEDIARRSYLFRTTGMGYTNLGGLLMSMAIPYGSELGRDLSAYLMSAMTAQCYFVSSLIAESVGPFEMYERNCSSLTEVISKHTFYSKGEYDIVKSIVYVNNLNNFVNIPNDEPADSYLNNLWYDTEDSVNKFGVRNAQVTVLAPTGTIAFAMDCASTSAEPFFSHVIYKKVVDGSTIQIINPLTKTALERLGYSENQILDIQEHLINTGSMYNAPHLSETHLNVFKVANDIHDELVITPDEHLRMVAKLTNQLSGAISKTVNLPNTATVEDISKVYMNAWKYGIKAITVYRDGSKVCQPLNLTMKEKSLDDLTYAELKDEVKELTEQLESRPTNECIPTRHKPHGIRTSRTHECVVGDLRIYITVTKDEIGKIREVFISCGKQGSLQKGLLESLSMIISMALQYNVPIDEIRKMLRGHNYQPSGFVGGHDYIKSVASISDCISKVLDIECGDYNYCQVKPEKDSKTTEISELIKILEDSYNGNEESNEENETPTYVYDRVCSKCGSTKMVKAGTCYYCSDCGNSSGGCS